MFERIHGKEVLCLNSKVTRKVIKRILIEEFGWENKCNKCELSKWLEKPIVIELEHKNGINTDNRIENLDFLCPNCHSQTSTWRARKNIKPDKLCIDCNIKIHRGNKSGYCRKCIVKHRKVYRKIIVRPSKEQLLKDLTKMSYVKVGKKYDVSDNTIRKWLI